MPLYGTAALDARAEMRALDTEPMTLERVEILHLLFEISAEHLTDLLPRAMHPTIPPTVTYVFWKASGFTLAQVRVGCRAGARPRGMPVAAWVDDDDAASWLESRWGLRCDRADVRLRRGHYQVTGEVPGVLDVTLMNPEPISGTDVHYTPNMNPAIVDGTPLLVQCDPEYAFHKAERGRPSVSSASGPQAVYPVSASYAVCDVTLPKIRYVCSPDVPATQGTRRVG